MTTKKPHLKSTDIKQIDAPIYEIKALSIKYKGSNVNAVDAFDCVINKNESVGLVGESGSGKTSIALSLLGLLDHAECSGALKLNGKTMPHQGEDAWNLHRWKDVAIVFQNALNVLNPSMRVIYQVTEPLIQHLKLEKSEAINRAKHLLTEVGLEPIWWQAKPHQLSGGMRQKVLIAMALACQPKLLILDEPTMSLDTESKKQVIHLIKELRARNGFSLLVISHELKLLEMLCDRIEVLYNGYHLESGKTLEVLYQPKHPYSKGLSMSSWELDRQKDIWGIPRALRMPVEKGCPFYNRCFQARDICKTYAAKLEWMDNKHRNEAHRVACIRGGIATILEAKNVSKKYKVGHAEIHAVKNANFDIKEGEIIALVGHSGSGKSTLASILTGIVNFEGEIRYSEGETLTARTQNGIQLITQDPSAAMNLNWRIRDIIIEPLNHQSQLSKIEVEEIVKHNLEKVHLPSTDEFLLRRAGAVSGGQRQRIAIARALSMNPRLLIADEISAMLDPSSAANIIRLLKGKQNKSGFAMLYITHDLYLARKIADRVMIMQAGEIIKFGASKTTLGDDDFMLENESISRYDVI